MSCLWPCCPIELLPWCAIPHFCYENTPIHPPLRRSKVTSPQIFQKAPYPVDVEAGKTYYWCACGQSKKQPFCDGSHKTTDIVPVAWIAEKTSTSYFCGCKHSKTQPLCDGSHAKL
ncbi:MAG: CDGSH iron-sulfur domain-containing protein [Methylocella sp.]